MPAKPRVADTTSTRTNTPPQHAVSVSLDGIGWYYAICSCNAWSGGAYASHEEAVQGHRDHLASLDHAH